MMFPQLRNSRSVPMQCQAHSLSYCKRTFMKRQISWSVFQSVSNASKPSSLQVVWRPVKVLFSNHRWWISIKTVFTFRCRKLHTAGYLKWGRIWMGYGTHFHKTHPLHPASQRLILTSSAWVSHVASYVKVSQPKFISMSEFPHACYMSCRCHCHSVTPTTIRGSLKFMELFIM